MQEVHAPSLEVIDALYDVCSKQIDTYELQPPNEVSYPFAYIGDQVSVDSREINEAIWKRTATTIHLYDLSERRGSLRRFVAQLEHSIRQLRATEHFYTHIEGLTTRTLTERDGNRELIHVILEVDIKTITKGRI